MALYVGHYICPISIHALRVEGDPKVLPRVFHRHISIHALRVEGDRHAIIKCIRRKHFYPRPPGGGRQLARAVYNVTGCISIHALRVEGDLKVESLADSLQISIHALRVEGDFGVCSTLRKLLDFYPRPPGGGRHPSGGRCSPKNYFYPRPPGGGRQQKRTKFSSVFAQKGEEFASLRRGKREFAGGVLKRTNFGF